MCSDRRENHVCGQKKPEGTSSAIFNVGVAANAANSGDVPTAFAAEHNKDEVLERQIS